MSCTRFLRKQSHECTKQAVSFGCVDIHLCQNRAKEVPSLSLSSCAAELLIGSCQSILPYPANSGSPAASRSTDTVNMTEKDEQGAYGCFAGRMFLSWLSRKLHDP